MYEIKKEKILGIEYNLFKVEDFVFTVDTYVNELEGYLQLEVNEKYNYVTAYSLIYDRKCNKILWDYSLPNIDSNKEILATKLVKESYIEKMMEFTDGKGEQRVLLKMEPGYFTKEKRGDEDPAVRDEIELIMYENIEEILETVDFIIAERLLD